MGLQATLQVRNCHACLSASTGYQCTVLCMYSKSSYSIYPPARRYDAVHRAHDRFVAVSAVAATSRRDIFIIRHRFFLLVVGLFLLIYY